MKKLLLIIIVLSLLPLSLFAEDPVYIAAPVPVNPVVMGQGGAFTANARNYNSLFNNPAGFAAGKGDITLLSVNGWVFLDQSFIDMAQDPEAYFAATQENVETFIAEFDEAAFAEWLAGKDEQEIIDLMTDLGLLEGWDPETEALEAYLNSIDWETALEDTELQQQFITLAAVIYEDLEGEPLLPSGNLRAGLNTGFGIVKKGFGLGLNLNADATFTGRTLLNAVGSVSTTASLTAGYALELFEFLKVGAALRPMYRAYSLVSGEAIMNGFENDDVITALDSSTVLHGWGVGLDLGAIASLGPFNVGLALTDFGGTRMNFNSVPWTEFYNGITVDGTLPEGTPAGQDYRIPMDVSLGASFHPDLGGLSAIIDPEVSVEFSDVVNALAAGEEIDFLSTLKFGATARLLSFIDLSAGYYAGYASAGLGLDLLFFNVNVAGFLKATDTAVGYSDYGVSAEVALRF